MSSPMIITAWAMHKLLLNWKRIVWFPWLGVANPAKPRYSWRRRLPTADVKFHLLTCRQIRSRRPESPYFGSAHIS